MMQRSTTTSGFTLIEMMVSVAIFTVAILILVTTLISLSNESKKARSSRIVTDNLSAATESMARSIRMGRSYNCGCAGTLTTPQACPLLTPDGVAGGATCIAFIPQNAPTPPTAADMTIFQYDAANKRITRSLDGGTTYQQFTAPEVKISKLKFFVNGVTAGLDQPSITMIIGGVANIGGKILTEYNMQTTISSRTPNFTP